MSIIEETLRNLEEEKEKEGVRQDVSKVKVVEKEASTNIKPARSLTFVVISIVLLLLGLGAYYGLEKYQGNLDKKIENLNYNSGPLKSLTAPVDDSQKDVASHENKVVIDSSQDAQVASVDDIQILELDQKETVIEHKIPETSMLDNVIVVPTAGSPLSDDQGIKSSQNDVLAAGSVDAVVLNQDTDAFAVSQETKPKQELNTEEHLVSVNQPDSKQSSAVPVEDLSQSDEKPASSLLEENIFGKQLKQARHLINIGSYSEAIDILKPIIDRQEETWDTYLLMGAAYLGLGELGYAETYSEMGLAINGKVPQLWLQCAIVEQQRGKHEAALRILNEAEKLAPDIPEVQLNIGYSYDAIGNQKLSAKAYNSFLKLTEGNPAYMMVRYKVLERLRNLK